MGRLAQLSVAVALAFAAGGCPSGHKDPPPPEEGAEITSAAPHALGALAGGTDAAPPAVLSPRRPTSEEPEAPLPELDPDAGVEVPEAGAAGGDELPL